MKKLSRFLYILCSLTRLSSQNKSEFELLISNGKLTGELTTVDTRSKTPLIIFIAGSGPTDRNGNSKMTKSSCYLKLSDSLISMNISTLRLDKRGVGNSKFDSLKEENMNIDTLVSDVVKVVDSMSKRKEFSTIYLLGHSEGSLIGMLASQKNKYVNGLISIAGAGTSADSIILSQLSSQPKQVTDIVEKYLDTLRQGKLLTNVPKSFYMLFRPSVQPYMISWLKYNPSIEISKLLIPILIIQGKSDLQVSVDDAIKLSKGNKNSELILLEKTNHVLKKVENLEENQKSYMDSSFLLSSELVYSVKDFVKKNYKR
jgi:pimeloyl-ACP methyl ester carboxylesterase